MWSSPAWVRSQAARRQPLARSVPVGKVPAVVGNRSQARPTRWSLRGFCGCGSQQTTRRTGAPGRGGPKAARVWSRAWRVAGVRQPRLVGSGWVQPLSGPVKAAGTGQAAEVDQPGAGCVLGRGVFGEVAVDGGEVVGDEGGAAGVAAGFAGGGDAGGRAGDPGAAGDVADQHGVERGGGLPGRAQVCGGGAQVGADERDGEVEVAAGVVDVGAGGRRDRCPGVAAGGDPVGLVELVEPGGAAVAVAAERGGVPAGFGGDFGDHPRHR